MADRKHMNPDNEKSVYPQFRLTYVLTTFSFFDNKDLSDVTIKFSGQQLFAHKIVLARKSKYFLKAFTGGFPVR